MQTAEQSVLALILPQGVLNWFDVVEGKLEGDKVLIVLEEKNIPPVTEEHKGKTIISKGFKHITITDFPIRGQRTLVTFKRRYWKVEGRDSYLKRDIKIDFSGTQLENQFALFLKEDSGR